MNISLIVRLYFNTTFSVISNNTQLLKISFSIVRIWCDDDDDHGHDDDHDDYDHDDHDHDNDLICDWFAF